MTSDWYCQVMEEAIIMHGTPDIVNTDQGSLFTSDTFTELLIDNGTRVSMDGKGRAIDNIFIERLWRSVKYEYCILHYSERRRRTLPGIGKLFPVL